MRKILLIAISGISFCTMPVQAQFNTIAKTPERYKVEALQEGMKKPEPTPESMAPAQETSTKPADESKKLWIDRYLSVSYPLQRIRITSPYGYRKDPFTMPTARSNESQSRRSVRAGLEGTAETPCHYS